MASALAVSARCGPCVRPSSSGRRMHAAPAAKAPLVVRLARPSLVAPRAFYRGAGSCGGGGSSWRGWSSQDEVAMKELLGDMMRQWKQAGSVGGAFYWPGGGAVYGSSSQWSRQGAQQQPQGDGDAAASAGGKAPLALDVVADSSFYLLYADVPGLTKPDLSIRLSKERRLTISGQRARPALEGGAGSVSERRFGPFSRSWALPDDADADGISAKVADGVLTITVPRKAPPPAEEQQQPEEEEAGTPIDIN